MPLKGRENLLKTISDCEWYKKNMTDAIDTGIGVCELCGDMDSPGTVGRQLHSTREPDRVICDACWDAHFRRCPHCRTWIQDGDFTTVEGQEVCEKCHDEESSRCDWCQDRAWNENTIVDDGTRICQSCYDNHGFRCEACCGIYHSENARSAGDRNLCESCYNDRYFYCLGCEGDIRLDDRCSECERCRDCCECEGTATHARINHYHSGHREGFLHFIGDGPLFLGVELEVECRDRHKAAEKVVEVEPTHVYMENDGSLSNGIEIISHPADLASHHDVIKWKNLCEGLNALQCKSHETTSCGLHIHVTREHFSPSEQVKIGVLVYGEIDRMEALGRRTCNHYCRKIDKESFKTRRPKQQNGVRALRSENRYEAVNFTNDKTVEFRLFKGTLKFTTLIATIELVHAICQSTKEWSLSELNNCGWDCLCKTIRDGGTKYDHIKAYMIDRGVWSETEPVSNRPQKKKRGE